MTIPPEQRHRRALTVALVLLALPLTACGDDIAEIAALDTKAQQDVPTVDVALDTAVVDAGCGSAAQCPQPTAPCQVARCTDGVCSIVNAEDGATCEDGDACTGPDACAAGKCAGASTCECQAPGDCDDKNDTDPCTADYYCDVAEKACKILPSTIVQCPDGAVGPCLKWACDPKDGQCRVAPDDSQTCADNDPCTETNACKGGECVVAKSKCACQVTADCAGLEDGDLCNGTYYCDAAVGGCKLNLASIVQCSEQNNTACFALQCDPKDGACKPTFLLPADIPVTSTIVAAAELSNCDTDGTHCSQERCKAGKCTFLQHLDPCGCSADKDCAALEDGNACNGTMYCSLATGTCVLNPATIVSCPTVADGPCSKTSCDKKTGKCALQVAADKTPCVDGSPCTLEAACKKGACKMTKTKCLCSETKQCAKHEKDIKDKCLGAKLYCDQALGACVLNPASKPVCDPSEDNACLTNRCDKKDGKCKPTSAPDSTPCEADGNLCTLPDQCQSGQCAAGENHCKCGQDSDCAKHDDGDPCNGTLLCDKSKGGPSTWRCEINPATTIACPAGAPCKPQVCDPADGQCKVDPHPDGHPCDADGSQCSVEHCKAGACTILANACQCPKGDDCAAFDDGNPCTGTLFCDKSGEKDDWACKVNPASIVQCKPGDGGVCQRHVCDPADGACKPQAFNEGAPCFDDDACTLGERCEKGDCVQAPGGATKTCADNNPCTADSCDKSKGCVFQVLAGSVCDDNNACTVADKCGVGGGGEAACLFGAATSCDDGNACTDDSCDVTQGCQHANNAASCDDGNACTLQDSCQGGQCKGAAGPAGALKCLDDGDCKAVGCDPAKGCTFKGAAEEICDGKRNVCGAAIDAGCDDDNDGHCDGAMKVATGATCAATLDAQKSGCPRVLDPAADLSKGGQTLALSKSTIPSDVPMVLWHGGRGEVWQVRPIRHSQVTAKVLRYDEAGKLLGLFDSGRRRVRQVAAHSKTAHWFATVDPSEVASGLLKMTGDNGAIAWVVTPLDKADKPLALDAIAAHGDHVLVAPRNGTDATVLRYSADDGKSVPSIVLGHPSGAVGIRWIASPFGQLLAAHTHQENNNSATVVRRYLLVGDKASVQGAPLQLAGAQAFAPGIIDGRLCATANFVHTCYPAAQVQCDQGDDCDDTTGDRSPTRVELCSGKDEDCDGVTDEGCDRDQDGFCAAGMQVVAGGPCGKETGAFGTDCHDGSTTAFPGAQELCDRLDNDCDGSVDEGCDLDQDGHCAANKKVLPTALCAKTLTAPTSSCKAAVRNDGAIWATRTLTIQHKTSHPATVAVGALPAVDELWVLPWAAAGSEAMGFRHSLDGALQAQFEVPVTEVHDVHGHASDDLVVLASANSGLTAMSFAKGALWTTKGVPGRSSARTVHVDGDAIWATFESETSLHKYNKAGQALAAQSIASITPNADHELAVITGQKLYWSDGKTFARYDLATRKKEFDLPALVGLSGGALLGTELCAWKSGNALSCFNILLPSCAAAGDDCNDTDNKTRPSVTETCDGQDNNCDGKPDETCDRDKDGFCATGHIIAVGAKCKAGKTGAKVGDDCRDLDNKVWWGVKEVCDGADDNCTGTVDEGCDDDQDGFCEKGFVVAKGAKCAGGGEDCDDNDSSVKPSKDPEKLCDEKDNNCNGKTDDGCDDDKDGYCAAGTTVTTNKVCAKTMSDMCHHPWLSTAVADGKCFMIDTSARRTFNPASGSNNEAAANSKCAGFGAAWGASLASIESEAQNAAVLLARKNAPGVAQKAGRPAPSGPTYIGLSDTAKDEEYVWKNGAVLGYQNFAADGKKAGGNQVAIHETTGEWLELAHGPPRHFVCQMVQKFDCDDSSATARPGGTEVCDGRDNDCDGKTDEGCDEDGDGFCTDKLPVLPGAMCAGSLGKDSQCTGVTPNDEPKKVQVAVTPDTGLLFRHPFRSEWWQRRGSAIHRFDDQLVELGNFAHPNLGNRNIEAAADKDEHYAAGNGHSDTPQTAVKFVGTSAGKVWQSGAVYIGDPAVTEQHVWVVQSKTARRLHALSRADGKHVATLTLQKTGVQPWALGILGDNLYVAPLNAHQAYRFQLIVGNSAGDGRNTDMLGFFDTPLKSASNQQPWAVYRHGFQLCVTGTKVGGESSCFGVGSRSCHLGGDDCDDSDEAVKPGKETVCDGKDSSCDGVVDDGCDEDGDGYCREGVKVLAGAKCDAKLLDCDDALAAAIPGGVEVCDGKDSNCDKQVDEGCDDDGDKRCDAALMVLPGAACTTTLSHQGRCADLLRGALDWSTAKSSETHKFMMTEVPHDGIAGPHPWRNELWLVSGNKGRIARYSPHVDKNGKAARLGEFALHDATLTALAGDPNADRWVACRPTPVGLVRFEGLGQQTISATSSGACFSISALGDRYYVLSTDAQTVKTHSADNLVELASVQLALGSLQSIGFYDGHFVAQRGTDAYRFDGVGKQVAKINLAPTTSKPRFFAMPHLVFSDNPTQGQGGTFQRINLFKHDLQGYFWERPDCVGGGDDCDDDDAKVSAQPEVLCDGKDNDCDGRIDELCDSDGDGYCAVGMTVASGASCSKTPVGKGNDCDDHDSGEHGGAVEVCNGKDDNCNVSIDEGCDIDQDGFCGKGMKVVAGAKCKVGPSACKDYTPLATPGSKTQRNRLNVAGYATWHPHLQESWIVRDGGTKTPNVILRAGPDSTHAKPDLRGSLVMHVANIRGAHGDSDTTDWFAQDGVRMRRFQLDGTQVWQSVALPPRVRDNPSVHGDHVLIAHASETGTILRIDRKSGQKAASITLTAGVGGGLLGPKAALGGFIFSRAKDNRLHRFTMAGSSDNFSVPILSQGRPFGLGVMLCENAATTSDVQCQELFEPACDVGQDCDESNGNIGPGAVEFCNGKDDDCDGVTDECNDGKACTTDACEGGKCAFKAASCDDGNSCTKDSCGVDTGCTFSAQPDGQQCDDGNPCTSGEQCDVGQCSAGTKLADNTPCGSGGKCAAGACDCGDGKHVGSDGKCASCTVTCGVGAAVGSYVGTGTALSLQTKSEYASSTNHNLGNALAGTASIVAAGALSAANQLYRGAVQIFDRQNDGSFKAAQYIKAPDEKDNRRFGRAVALQGEVLLTSSAEHANGGSSRGKVYEFRRQANKSWQAATGPAPESWGQVQLFGMSIAWRGSSAVIGAPGDDTGGTDRGSVLVFRRNSDQSWSEIAKLQPASSKTKDRVGDVSATAFDGEQIALGSPRGDATASDKHGRVWVFRSSAGKWTETADIAPPQSVIDSTAQGDGKARFGRAVAIDGARLVVGAPGESSKKNGGGAILLYRRDEAGEWGFSASIHPDRSEVGDSFPAALAMRGDRLLVGCNGCEAPGKSGENTGRGFLFRLSGASYTESQELSPKKVFYYELYGGAVTFAGEDALLGAVYTDNPSNPSIQHGGTDRVGGVYHFAAAAPSCTSADACTCATGYQGKLCDQQHAPTAPESCESGKYSDPESLSCQPCGCGEGTYSDPSAFTLGALIRGGNLKDGEQLGRSVAIEGDWLITGADLAGKGSGKKQHGAVQVYRRNGAGFSLSAFFANGNATEDGRMGAAVALDDGHALAGAPGATVGGNGGAGRIHMFRLESGTWKQKGALAPSSGLTPGAAFGVSLAMDDGWFVAGAEGLNHSSKTTGGAYVARWDGGKWTDLQLLAMPENLHTNTKLGHGVSMHGPRLAVAAPGLNVDGDLGRGGAWIYERSDKTWSLVAGPLHRGDNVAGGCGQVALDGDRLLMGCETGIVAGGVQAGAAYVFERASSGQWSYKSQLPVQDKPQPNDFAGVAVALRGDLAAVGVSGADLNGTDAGLVQVFALQGGAWTLQKTLQPSIGAGDKGFGRVLALAGRTLVIGMPSDFGSAVNDGAVHVASASIGACDVSGQCPCAAGWGGRDCTIYQRDICPAGQRPAEAGCVACGCGDGAKLDPWSFAAGTKISGPSITASDMYGGAIAVDGELALVGAHNGGDLVSGRRAGLVVPMSRQPDGSWKAESSALQSTQPTKQAYFGWAIDLDGQRAVVSARDTSTVQDRAGQAYVFERAGGKWQQKALLRHQDQGIFAADLFGDSVGLSGSWAAIGASGRDDGEANQGAVYLFKRDASGQWLQTEKLQPAALEAGDGMGSDGALEMDRDDLFVGAPKFQHGGVKGAGQLFCYRRSGNRWHLVQRIGPTSPTAQEFSRPRMVGDTLFIGAPGEKVGNKPEGSVHVYARTGDGWVFKQILTLGPSVLKGPGSGDGARLGDAITSDGQLLAVGAPNDSSVQLFGGSVQLFERQANGTFGHVRALLYDDGANGSSGAGDTDDRIGAALALTNGRLLVGATRLDGLSKNGGGVIELAGAAPCNADGRCSCRPGKTGQKCDQDGCLEDSHCDDGNACTIDRCDPATAGCAFISVQDGAACSDGEPCTAEACVAGTCTLKGSDGDGTGCGNGGKCQAAVCGCGPESFLGADGTCQQCACAAGTGLATDVASIQEQKLPKPDLSGSSNGQQVGHAVAASSHWVVVGAPNFKTAQHHGAAFVYRANDQGAFSLAHAIKPLDNNQTAQFGGTVAAGGERIAVGAVRDDTRGSNAGAVRVHEVKPWGALVEVRKLAPAVLKANDGFGTSLTMSSSRLVVGAPGHDGLVEDGGAAWVFERGAGSWTEAVRVAPTGLNKGDRAGDRGAVSMSGDELAIGAPGRDRGANANELDDGAVFLFALGSGGWTQQALIVPAAESGKDVTAAPSTVQRCGPVALGAGHLLIGCPGDGAAKPGRANVGSAYFYRRDEKGAWTLAAKVFGDVPDANDIGFGQQVQLSGHYATIACPGCNPDGSATGAAYLFERAVSGWTLRRALRPAAIKVGDQVTRAAIVGGSVFVGSPGFQDGAGKTGAVHRFRGPAACSRSGDCTCAPGFSGQKCEIQHEVP